MPTNDEAKSGVEIAIPLSVTDIARGTRQIIGLLRDLGKLAGSAGDLFDRYKARGAAKNLANLSFERGGMREPLGRIASGNWSDEDIDSIERQLVETAEEVQQSIHGLSKYKDRLRQDFGLRVATKLDDIIQFSLDSYSKPWIRDGLQYLVMNARIVPDNERMQTDEAYREYIGKQREFVQATAKDLVDKIQQLNERVIEMHDLVLPPKKKVASSKKQNTSAKKGTTKKKEP